jgi:hypothetical protein
MQIGSRPKNENQSWKEMKCEQSIIFKLNIQCVYAASRDPEPKIFQMEDPIQYWIQTRAH